MSLRPERPSDAEYYERDRIELFSQGDLFRDVPLAYPMPADELVVDDEEQGGRRRFLSGPLEFGPAMLITPSCSMGAQGTTGYGHPVRTLVPLLPLDKLVAQGVVKETALDDLRRFDHLINYMYLPPLDVDELRPQGSGPLGGSKTASSAKNAVMPSTSWRLNAFAISSKVLVVTVATAAIAVRPVGGLG